MGSMFRQASSFNGNISNWDTSSVTGMSGMFNDANSFNQDISRWDVSKVTGMSYMFNNAYDFNQNLSNWNTSSVYYMDGMFQNAISFNGNISNWDLSSIINIYQMFYNATSFNQDVSSWDVSNVNDMSSVFRYATSFNQDISTWDVSGVTDMRRMFENATSFNQNLSNWNVTNLAQADYMFDGVTLSTPNYDSLLIGWEVPVLQNGTVFDGGNSKYSISANESRFNLTDYWNWTITDGGLEGSISNLKLEDVDGTNLTNSNLNCSAIVSGSNMNVTVKWYRNGSDNLTLYYNNSYNGQINFESILNSGNTTKYENWSCSMNAYFDTSDTGWYNSSNLTILNHFPVQLK
jgi:surface protein